METPSRIMTETKDKLGEAQFIKLLTLADVFFKKWDALFIQFYIARINSSSFSDCLKEIRNIIDMILFDM